MTTFDALRAAEFTGTLWAAIDTAGGPRRPATAGHRHLPGAYDSGWLAALPLPIEENRPQNLIYATHPCTQVYEDIGCNTQHAWYALVAQHLGRLAGCEFDVVCSIFESGFSDEVLYAHEDKWFGAIVQMSGAKQWGIGAALPASVTSPACELTTEAGDILLLPKGLLHVADTPKEPGHSVHLSFAIHRDP
jgi:hypothetical protein